MPGGLEMTATNTRTARMGKTNMRRTPASLTLRLTWLAFAVSLAGCLTVTATAINQPPSSAATCKETGQIQKITCNKDQCLAGVQACNNCSEFFGKSR